MSIIVLNQPKFNTITVSDSIEILDQPTNVLAFNKRSVQNVPNIEKKGNFSSWIIRIFQNDKTDIEWATLKTDLLLLNDGDLKNFTPDTVDNSSIIYKCFFWVVVDEINLAPDDFIWVKIVRFYANGNEV